MKKFIYSWNPLSKGARSLAAASGFRRVRHHRSRFKGHPGKLLVNWGASSFPSPEMAKCAVVNHPSYVRVASDKRKTFELLRMKRYPFLPWFCVDFNEAVAWLELHPKRSIVARMILNGHGGQGIEITSHPEALPRNAGMYVEYVAKKEEYRIHVLQEKLFMQQKKRRVEVPDHLVDWRIRTHGNGFNYVHLDVRPPDDVIRAAKESALLLGLSFCAIDIGWNEKHQKAVFFEANTAPGLEGTTLREYADFLKSL